MCRRTVVLARTIASALAAVDDVCRELRALMHDMGLCAMAFDVEITARELLNNAVIHGNCSDVSRSVDLRFVVGRRWVSLKVTDQGHGFDWRRAKNRPLPAAEATQNRGFVIARDVSAQLSFNRVGNSVTARWPCPVERHIGGV
jgi:serine/threonine-protein kinase RsbW